MYALFLTLCFSNGGCYDTVPEVFPTMAECFGEMRHLRETEQVAKNRTSCKFIEDK
ncbi:hypothetical protein D3C84_104090 [compost metagenome]